MNTITQIESIRVKNGQSAEEAKNDLTAQLTDLGILNDEILSAVWTLHNGRVWEVEITSYEF